MTTTSGAEIERRARLYALYERMWQIRAFEETVAKAHEEGALPGLLHLSIGGEAVAAGVATSLSENDRIFSSHRPHGHFLAAGVEPRALFAELDGRETGLNRGRAGSMHLMADRAVMATGVVGGTIPVAIGHAEALPAPAVAVAFFGDGAVQTGVFHESLNLAALWKARILFVLENNEMVEFAGIAEHTTVADLTAHARLHGMPTRSLDGADVEAVARASAELLAGVRAGNGPAFLECRISRLRPHYEGDLRRAREGRDPLERARAELAALGASEAELAAVANAARAAMARLLEEVFRDPPPNPADDAALVFARPLE